VVIGCTKDGLECGLESGIAVDELVGFVWTCLMVCLLKSGYVMVARSQASERMIFLVFTKVEVAMEP
jgi:hypothetical protein